MRHFRSFNHSMCKTVLNLLQAINLRLRKIVVESYSSQVWSGSSDGTGCFRIKIRTNSS